MNVILNLSVHDLVDLLLRKGDIDNRIFNKATMSEGTKVHAFYQSKAGPNYLSEYPLKISVDYGEYTFNIQGRADGIIVGEEIPTIDEIKSCVGDLKEFYHKNLDWHLGQAKLYAFMYLKEQNLDKCNVLLTYISQVNNDIEKHRFSFTLKELENFVIDLLEQYVDFYDVIKVHREERNASCSELKFPYLRLRKNQEEMILNILESIKNKEKIMVEAATGMGKTVSTLFPHIKCFGKGIEKIFFATAKGSGNSIVKKTLEPIFFKGAKIKSVFINAKDKMCLNHEQACNPDQCIFAKDYYSKLTSIIIAILKDKTVYYDEDYFVKMGKLYDVCPFELSLDVSSFCDIIICDYNYIFDPFVYLERFILGDTKEYSLLIDEGHNLVSRSRNMYSVSIEQESLLKAKKASKGPDFKSIRNILKKIEHIFSEDLTHFEKSDVIELESFDNEFIKLISSFTQNYSAASKNSKISLPLDLRDFYLECVRFSKLYEYNKDGFVYYLKKNDDQISYRIYCVSATKYISSIINLFHNCILFSATLTPFDYYKNIIFGSDSEIKVKKYLTPFDLNHLNLMVNAQVSMKYQNRLASIEEVANNIRVFCESKLGNYLVFVPSFEYISLLKKYLQIYDADIFYQKEKMSIYERNDFINSFQNKPDKTTVCVAVLGGSFSESIDLTGDLLIGVVVLGVGFPQLNFENNKIKDYYDQTLKEGFDYAYVYPGMNNVTQAVGRLIRSETDLGSVLLIDDRYRQSRYLRLFKDEWKYYKKIYSTGAIISYVKKFYENNEK